jgi:hypothetical protein
MNAYIMLIGRCKGYGVLGAHIRGWNCDIKMDLKDSNEGVVWIDLSDCKAKWQPHCYIKCEPFLELNNLFDVAEQYF